MTKILHPPAKRISKLEPFFFASIGPRLAELKTQGYDIIRLDVGSPDLPPHSKIIKMMALSASKSSHHGYQSHRGPTVLREAWAEMYSREFGVDLDPKSEILPLIGSKEGIFHLIITYIQNGDVVLIPDPGYVTYSQATLFSGGEKFQLPLHPENEFLPIFEGIPNEILVRSKMLWLNYPNNPTSATATLEFFDEAISFARINNLLICHDAAYTQVTFEGKNAPSILQIPGAKEVAVEFNSLSKSHNMAGWRTGAVVGNPNVIENLFSLKSNTDSGHFLPIIDASIAAMTGDQSWLIERNNIYRKRRDVVVQGLVSMGLTPSIPKASIYVWVEIPPKWNSNDFASEALDQAHVSMTPGSFFGDYGEGYVRIALTEPLDRLAIGMERLSNWMSK